MSGAGAAWCAPCASGPLVIAHRGASADAVENTMQAFRLARVQGADGVELDVMRCGSGEVVVFHDEDLRRLAGQPGRVRFLGFASLREIDLGGGERIPLLSEVLEELGDDLLVNVELKTLSSRGWWLGDEGLAAEVAAILRRHQLGDRVLVSSFDPLLLARFRAAAPAVPTGLLFAAQQAVPLRRGWAAPLLRTQAVHPEAALVDAVAVRRWQRRGRAVHVWTVDDPAELRCLAALGVDAVITNRPALARTVLRDCAPLGDGGAC